MDTTLTSSQITSYRQNGYLAIENLLDASELATWRQAIDRAVDDTVSSNDNHHNQRDPDAYYSRVFVQCVNLWKTHDAVRELALDANLGRMAAELAGAAGVRLYHDHALVKAPWAKPHQLPRRQSHGPLLLATEHYAVGRARRFDPAKRLPLLPARLARI
tara:strand:- start:443 stop:922 length:480 start_codon:yes stop_codon:yes gene_type:complete